MTHSGDPAPAWVATIEATGQRFEVAQDETLLRAAERAGLAWPHSCRNGSCRACLLPLRAGKVSYRIEWPGLLPEEKTGGWVLPCVAYPQSDVVLAG